MKKIILTLMMILISTSVFSRRLKFSELHGTWSLKYPGPYGYEFRFKKNYTVYTILYLKRKALVFKGIYTTEENNIIRINISDLKTEWSFRNIEKNKGFARASSSHFTFKAERKGKTLTIKPQNIIIDGMESNGYFEPVIKLKKK